MPAREKKTPDAPDSPARSEPDNAPLTSGELAQDKGADRPAGDPPRRSHPDEIEIERGDTIEPGDSPSEIAPQGPPDVELLPPD